MQTLAWLEMNHIILFCGFLFMNLSSQIKKTKQTNKNQVLRPTKSGQITLFSDLTDHSDRLVNELVYL